MLFPHRVDDLPAQSGVLGQLLTFSISREFHISTIWLVVDVTPSAAMATANADGLQAIIKNITLNMSDGARTRTVVSISGPGLLEYCKQIYGTLDRDTLTNVNTNPSSGTKRLVFPIPFALPNLEDPAQSMLLLPAPRAVTNLQLNVQIANQVDLDSNATPTSAFSAITVRPVIDRRFVAAKNWGTFDTELTESVYSIATDQANQVFELPSPGSYTAILIRTYTSLTARGSIAQSGGYFNLQLLGTKMRRFRDLDLQFINDMSMSPNLSTVGIFSGSYMMDFLSNASGATASEFGSVLDANVPVATGARLQLVADLAGAANKTMKLVTHRIYGNLDPLKMAARFASGAKKA